ncbi:MAG: DUF362 domain-containing protein [Clostridia bacterium]|nr:DUF362 domain-containing protein [Clostridia bacterium]
MAKVALVKCDSYSDAPEAVAKAIDLIGGVDKVASREEKLLLKPNFLTKCPPEKACTTHPEVFRGVAEYLQKNGYTNLFYGDSQGHGDLNAIAKESGVGAVADELNIPLADFFGGRSVPFPEGRTANEFVIANGIVECDGIINVCKMKTHMLERITGAQKNIFGCVFGLNKGAAHVKYPSASSFAKMLADLNLLLKPRLHIMDGVMAMEGNGPQSGTPKKMGVILASTDSVALDTVFASLVYLDPLLVPTNVVGDAMGVGTCKACEIEVVTEDGTITVDEARERYGDKDFDVYRGIEDKGEISFLRPFKKLISRRPKIDKKLCVSCGICVKSCPVEGGAVNFKKKGKPPVYDYKKCISCYCCQEMCPKKAIYAYQNPIAKIANIKFKI